MKIFEEVIDFEKMKDRTFKEDSVREVIIAPILKKLGYTSFGDNKIVRSKNLKHPYVQFGTRKEKINIIPDYLCEVDSESKFILDAKSPTENIVTGKNVEQAYSYAIHREVKAKIYALCNGLELIVFHVDELEPLIHLKVSTIEENWDKLVRILSPTAFIKPYIFNFKPDLGIRMIKSGVSYDLELHLLGAWVNTVGKVNENLFTIMASVPYGEDCAGSFDFTKEQFEDFMNQVPQDKYNFIRNSLTAYPYSYHSQNKDDSFEVMFSCQIGDRVYQNDDESYIPFIITSFK